MRTIHFPLLIASVALGILAPHAEAIVYDLSASSTVVVPTAFGTAIFTTDFTQPAGTGILDPFLTIQANGTEQGYNTSNKKGVFDTKREPQYNHELRLSDLETVEINGAEYFSFLIDVNEPNSSTRSMISLDAIKIYSSPTAGKTTTNIESLGTKRFDLDMPTDNYILYNDLNSGSGQADIAFFIPTASFLTGPNAVKSTDYIYMYQLWGTYASADYDGSTQGGFEETAVGRGVGVRAVPEVTSILPLAGVFGLVVAHQWRRRRRVA